MTNRQRYMAPESLFSILKSFSVDSPDFSTASLRKALISREEFKALSLTPLSVSTVFEMVDILALLTCLRSCLSTVRQGTFRSDLELVNCEAFADKSTLIAVDLKQVGCVTESDPVEATSVFREAFREIARLSLCPKFHRER
ncbi:hypothetical protein BDP27DRAFT_1417198 [Rhodocollybia butyracea]|uniref:Uncharacterized protein n=1 Tax=Rhodocollybia butyracea TaxID=206335 RepID=A0A9P5UAT1_9AGAR|nr:hypothetical protein BDP27DRAFT_1417198 [Rhodocollybia butyracea]